MLKYVQKMSGLVLPPPENKPDVNYAPYKDETEMRNGQKINDYYDKN
jgi:hypothetical protein